MKLFVFIASNSGNPNLRVSDMHTWPGTWKKPILQRGSDKMIRIHVYDKPFTIRFPDRSEWKKGFQLDRNGGLIWFTDGSKTAKVTGAGVCCQGTRRKLSFSLGRHTTVFQAEVYAIKAFFMDPGDFYDVPIGKVLHFIRSVGLTKG
jgi:hypothetical protein